MNKKLIIWGGVIAFTLLCFLCLYRHTGRIEQDLSARTRAYLTATNITASDVSFQGRDATITGQFSKHDLATVKNIVPGVTGVRTIDIVTTESGVPAWLNATFSSGVLKLNGLLNSADMHNRFIEKIAGPLGKNNIIDSTIVKNGITPSNWLQSMAVLIPEAYGLFSSGSIAVRNDTVHLNGEVPDIKSTNQLVTKCQQLFPEMVINNNLYLSAATTATGSIDNLNPQLRIKHIEFDFNSSALMAQATDRLNEVKLFLDNHPQSILEISGHTDSLGDTDYNLELSRLRANAVAQYLKQKGIPGNRMKIVSHGDKIPVADNNTTSGRQQNRRVELDIIN